MSIKGTDSSLLRGNGCSDGYESSQFPNGTFTTNSGGGTIGNSYINLSWKLSKEDLISGRSYTAYYQTIAESAYYSVFYAIKLVINNDNTISIYAITPFISYISSSVDPTQSESISGEYSFTSSTTILIVNNV